VAQGRGTQVARSGSWNMLDPIVLSALIDNDESLSILDELTIVRGNLESAMAGTVAGRHTPEELTRIEHVLGAMREMRHDSDAFRQEDVVFHFTVMEISRNRLAENIAKRLYRRALESSRYHGVGYKGAFESTLEEHRQIVEAISRQDIAGAERAMRDHIVSSWQRRRPAAPRRTRPSSRVLIRLAFGCGPTTSRSAAERRSPRPAVGRPGTPRRLAVGQPALVMLRCRRRR